MSMLQIAQELYATLPEQKVQIRPRQATAYPPTALRVMWDGLREGLEAYRRYENLKSWRVADDVAARDTLVEE